MIKEIMTVIQFENGKFLGMFGEVETVNNAIKCSPAEGFDVVIKQNPFVIGRQIKFVKVLVTHQIIQ